MTVVFLEDALDLEEVVEWGLALRVVFLIRAAVRAIERVRRSRTRDCETRAVASVGWYG